VVNGKLSTSFAFFGAQRSQLVLMKNDYVYCRFLDKDAFVNAIMPSGDLTRIDRAQFGILFRVADASKRGFVSWDDFKVFETLLKRPDSDYWIAFQYFDVYVKPYNSSFPHNTMDLKLKVSQFQFQKNRDGSGTITYDEFKNVFASNLGPDSIPFDFDW
jgi:solute carrier family 25 aspartate/glutamate transporter 12/13